VTISESAVVKLAKRTTTQVVCGGTVEGATAIDESLLKITVEESQVIFRLDWYTLLHVSIPSK
jgi:hypothetical protein